MQTAAPLRAVARQPIADLLPAMAARAPVSLVRITAILPRLGIGRTMFYDWIKTGRMTPGLPLGTARTAPTVWPSTEVDAIVEAIIAGKSDDERRALVATLLAQRKQPAQGH